MGTKILMEGVAENTWFTGGLQLYINFEQHTWKDFPSYLSEEHLQNRYDEYIKVCDIVIFLFHTHIGKYTMRELNVAFEEIKKNKKRPKIYIYVKRGHEHEKILEELKRYSEEVYGHFCDTYSDYNDLFRHFNYQLEKLEEENFFQPDRIDLPRTKRFIILCFLPMVIVGLFLLAYNLWQPSFIQIELKEQIPTNLQFKEGTLSVNYADINHTFKISELEKPVEIKGIGSKYRWFNKFRIKFEAPGYITTDTLLQYSEHITISVRRDMSAGILKGTITDENRFPICGATVKVLEYSSETDNKGYFHIEIPLQQQTNNYRVTVIKEGFDIWDYSGIAPSGSEYIQIVLHKYID